MDECRLANQSSEIGIAPATDVTVLGFIRGLVQFRRYLHLGGELPPILESGDIIDHTRQIRRTMKMYDDIMKKPTDGDKRTQRVFSYLDMM